VGIGIWKSAAIEAIATNLSVVHGPIQQRYPVLRTCFGKNVAHMVVDGAFADGQTIRDFLVGETLCHQLNDLNLPGRQRNVQGISCIAG
jgi:hypothetical protein